MSRMSRIGIRLIGGELVLLLLLCLAIATGVRAQGEPTPTPAPVPTLSGASQSIVSELNKTGEIITGAMDRQGTSQVVLVLLVIAVIIIVIVLIRPTIASNTESNRALVALTQGQQAREQGYVGLLVGNQTAIAANTAAFVAMTEQSKARQSTDKDVVTVLTSVYDTNLTMKSLLNKYREEGFSVVTNQMAQDKKDLNNRLDLIIAGLRSLKADIPEQAPRIEALTQAAEGAKMPEEPPTLSDTGRLLDRLNRTE